MLEFKLLGPVEVRVEGRAADIGTLKQRAVLAVLLLEAGRPVRTADLIDRVWGADPPQAASSVIYGHLSRIRGLLGRLPGAVTLDKRPDGYLLNVDPDLVDVHRARRLAATTAGEPALREAIGLWGAEPLAGLTGSWFAQVRDELRHQRLDLMLRWAGAALKLGHYAEVIEAIRPVLADHPLVEPVAAVLIRALHAAGRGAEALDCYATTRARLAEELGVDPGPELRDLHRRILRGDPGREAPPAPAAPVTATPAHLPLDAYGFTGREAELARLDAVLTGDGEPAVRVITLAGTAGVGKTALALHWAHRVKARFPGGQLYVNLRGYDAGESVMRPSEGLRGFLEALGVAPRRVPSGLRARSDLFRSLVAAKRVLVVLDNARDADQVRPLLPGSAGCLVVVTSRDALAGLIVLDGAQPLRLDVLPPETARRLLTRRIGPRAEAEPEAAATIARRCAGVPLALAITAARAVVEPGLSLGDLARQLAAGDRALDALDIDRDTSMRAVLSWSYRALSPAAARVFRLFGLHPGTGLTIETLASLAGVPVAEAREPAAELVAAHQLDEDRGRFAAHDLLREYAAELATAAPADDGAAARRRLLDHYLHGALTTARLIETAFAPIDAPPPAPGVTVPAIAGREEAFAWFAAEHHNLTVIVALAAASGAHEHTWRFGLALSRALDNQGHWHDWVTIMRHARAAAAALGDQAVQARAERHLARAYVTVGSYAEARVHYERALRLYAAVGDLAGQASTHFSLSFMASEQGDPAGSLRHAELSLELFEAAGHRLGQGRALNAVGWDHALRGDHERALTYCRRALDLLQAVGDDDGQAAAWDSIGYVHAQRGDPGRAVPCYEKALDLYRRCGDRHNEADVLEHLGDTHARTGDHDAARAAWQQALTILRELGHADAIRIEAKLSPAEARHHPS